MLEPIHTYCVEAMICTWATICHVIFYLTMKCWKSCFEPYCPSWCRHYSWWNFEIGGEGGWKSVEAPSHGGGDKWPLPPPSTCSHWQLPLLPQALSTLGQCPFSDLHLQPLDPLTIYLLFLYYLILEVTEWVKLWRYFTYFWYLISFI